ncbi:alpha/beta fold hydrolase [Paenibacillus taichungensis]|uniref:Alpha/beta hydrolase n=1 Tax=Paenibacillus taichungensis TaxID=484184 RepID=A0A329QM05_9BACL|nr:alpha/beta hydrolase [Paenibacillus taichungensis]RAW12951.1 alpha/beta hydrolase [Paenibacillus taichungensis]
MMKKITIIILKILGAIVIALALFIATVYFVNVFSNKSEEGKIKPYGQSVAVDGKNMNVLIQGKGEETVVLLPGYGTPAPALDFKPLIDELSPFYKVVVIEPFGYGLSDVSEKERTIDNMVSEIHEALQQLNITHYTLMGHSISGIYGLDYVNKYPNEVNAFVGIDSSVPTQGGNDGPFPTETYKLLKKSGFYRLLMKLAPDQLIAPDVDDDTREQIRMLSLKNTFNPNNLSEGENFGPNFKAAEDLTFPKDLPVIFFLQANDTETEGWIPLHEEQVKNSVHGKVMTFEGGHYLHHTRSKEITENFRKFMNEVK